MPTDNPIFELADQLKQLREEKDVLDATLKELNARIEDTEYRQSNIMAESETQSISRAGTLFYLSTKTRASSVSGAKDQLYAALKSNGYGDLVYETVNANSLASFVKEQIGENGDALPEWLDGLVNVYDQTSVGVRKATKR